MIDNIKICGLFGTFNYSIKMNQNITIIYGPNGCGKTTILAMLHALFNETEKLIRYEFDSFQIIFDNTDTLKITKKLNLPPENNIRDFKKKYRYNDSENSKGNYYSLEYQLVTNGKTKSFSQQDSMIEVLEHVWPITRSDEHYKYLIPHIERLSEDTWMDYEINKSFSTKEFVNQYYYIIQDTLPKIRGRFETPREIKNLLESIKAQFIQANRLIEIRYEKANSYSNELTPKYDPKVSANAIAIAEKMKVSLQDYGTFSQNKDRSFPIRAIEDREVLSVQEIKDKLMALEDKRKQLIDLGMLEEETSRINTEQLMSSVTTDTQKMLSLYAKDTEEKLNVLESFASSLSLYKRILDKKFVTKEIVFNKEKGYMFREKMTGKIIKADNLSSGEQHELVLFYDLIFNTDKKTLVLIDEPELSLHIKWQLEFVDDLQKVIDKSGFTALIATHSPQIIDDRWELTMPLIEGEQ